MNTILTNTLNAYKKVIADLEGQAETYEPNALDETLSILTQRVWEIENVFADVLAEELVSMERHPSRMAKKLFATPDAE